MPKRGRKRWQLGRSWLGKLCHSVGDRRLEQVSSQRGSCPQHGRGTRDAAKGHGRPGGSCQDPWPWVESGCRWSCVVPHSGFLFFCLCVYVWNCCQPTAYKNPDSKSLANSKRSDSPGPQLSIGPQWLEPGAFQMGLASRWPPASSYFLPLSLFSVSCLPHPPGI